MASSALFEAKAAFREFNDLLNEAQQSGITPAATLTAQRALIAALIAIATEISVFPVPGL